MQLVSLPLRIIRKEMRREMEEYQLLMISQSRHPVSVMNVRNQLSVRITQTLSQSHHPLLLPLLMQLLEINLIISSHYPSAGVLQQHPTRSVILYVCLSVCLYILCMSVYTMSLCVYFVYTMYVCVCVDIRLLIVLFAPITDVQRRTKLIPQSINSAVCDCCQAP